MDWNAIGAIGEILGAVAVIVTLLYLAKQTQISSRAAISNARSASAIAIAELDRDVARDVELAKILQQSFQVPKADYNDLDWLRFTTFARSLFYLYEESFIQALYGTSDPEAAQIHVAAAIGFIEYPAWRVFWENETRGDTFRKAFVDAVSRGQTRAKIDGAVVAGRS